MQRDRFYGTTMKAFESQVAAGERFEFGGNWKRFLSELDEARLEHAKNSIKRMLECDSLEGMSFLDVGSGSGVFSLAARQLGARVHSFDFDPQSVECTRTLKALYYRDDPNWRIDEGSVLDREYLEGLGRFDVVYCWGVLHHTGAMWQAMDATCHLLAEGGKLYLAIYNDQGAWSRRWKTIKRIYNRVPRLLKVPYALLILAPRELKIFLACALKGQPLSYVKAIVDYGAHSMRGMSYWHDMIDWVGGYPFEVAKPEEVFMFCRQRGFALLQLRTSGSGIACNEFVFRRQSEL